MSVVAELGRSVAVRRCLGVAGAGLFVGLAPFLTGYVPDPAWGSIRYAQHLAAGAGPVWNLGGERVEGFASPLLLAVQILAIKAGINPMGAGQVLGILVGLATLGVVYRLGGKAIGALPAALAVLFIGTTPAFSLWAVAGTDTPIVALLITFATLDLLGGGSRFAAVALAVLPLLRAEGLVFAVAIAMAGTAFGPNWKNQVVKAMIPVVVVTVAVTLVRVLVFGQTFPNAVYFRFGSAEPFATVSEFVQLLAPTLPFAVLGAVAAGGVGIRMAVCALVIAFTALLTMDSVTAFARPAISFLPLVALLAGRGLMLMSHLGRGLVGAFAFVLGMTGVVYALRGVPGLSVAAAHESERDLSECRSAVRSTAALWLKSRLEPDDSYVVADAGEFSLVAGGISLDLLGLHDPSLAITGRPSFGARARWALKQRPNWLVIRGKADVDALQPYYGYERSIVADQSFAAEYAWVVAFTKPRCDVTMWVYQRR